jgi:hypothetical protein
MLELETKMFDPVNYLIINKTLHPPIANPVAHFTYMVITKLLNIQLISFYLKPWGVKVHNTWTTVVYPIHNSICLRMLYNSVISMCKLYTSSSQIYNNVLKIMNFVN